MVANKRSGAFWNIALTRAGWPGHGRDRATDCRLLAWVPKLANTDTIALSRSALSASSRHEHGSGTPRCGRAVQDSQPSDCRSAGDVHASAEDQPISQGARLSSRAVAFTAAWIAKFCSGSGPATPTARALRKATPTSRCGIFMTCCFTPVAIEGRQPNPLGGVYSYSHPILPLSAVAAAAARTNLIDSE